MRALITGSVGFLGRHFVAELERRGHVVLRVDTAEKVFAWDALDFFRTEINERIDLVIHCAAVHPHRSAIDGTPLRVGAGNLELDAAMFQWAARTKPGRVVYFSSSAAYPIDLQNDFATAAPLAETALRSGRHNIGRPDGSYGWVKLTGEQLADWYRAQGGKVTVVRPFSGYGDDQSADFPFGAFRDRARRREDPFVIWGTGDQVRDWIHVDDLVAGTLAAVEQQVDGALNLCTGVGTSMEELATLFMAASGYCPEIEYHVDAPAGVAYRVGDPTRMLEVYRPKVSLDEGVARALKTHVGA